MRAVSASTLTQTNERGSTLVVVLVIMLVMTLAITALVTVTMNTTGMVADDRDTVQSRAAADAGLAAAIATVERNGATANSISEFCAPTTVELEAPTHYLAQAECDPEQHSMTFTSTGWGSDDSASTVTATYSFVTPQPAPPKPATDNALYAASSFTLSNGIVITPVGEHTSVDLRVGASTKEICYNGSVIPGNVYVAEGDVRITHGCHISGDLYAQGNVTISSTNISLGSIYTSGTVTQTNSSDIRGDIIAGGDIDVVNVAGSITGGRDVSVGRVGGDVTALRDVTLKSNARVQGSVRSGGTLVVGSSAEVQGSTVSGGTTTLKSSGSRVRGSVLSDGKLTLESGTQIDGAATTNDALEVRSSNARIGGQATAIGNVTANGARLEGGIVTGGRISTNNTTITGNATSSSTASASMGNSTTVTGTLTLAGGVTGNPTTELTRTNVTGLTPPARATIAPIADITVPTAPPVNWINYEITSAGWEGYVVEELESCSMSTWSHPYLPPTQLTSATVPTIFDASRCAEVNLAAQSLALQTDIAILVGQNVQAQQLTVESADSTVRRFDIIQNSPGASDAARPTCPNPGTVANISGMNMKDTVHGVLYTPCKVNASNLATWRGNIQAGEVNIASGLNLFYEALTLPGFTEDTTVDEDDPVDPAPGDNDTFRLGPLISRGGGR